jgi:hypothetical protein
LVSAVCNFNVAWYLHYLNWFLDKLKLLLVRVYLYGYQR